MGLKSSLSHVILAVTGSMLLSTTVVAEGTALSYAAGNTSKSPVECARDATATLSAGGFTDRLGNAGVTAPHQGTVGLLAARPDVPQGAIGLIICTEHRDVVVIVVGNGSQPVLSSLLQIFNGQR